VFERDRVGKRRMDELIALVVMITSTYGLMKGTNLKEDE
jgi:hypothetical protein